jgi:hypothetical protein
MNSPRTQSVGTGGGGREGKGEELGVVGPAENSGENSEVIFLALSCVNAVRKERQKRRETGLPASKIIKSGPRAQIIYQERVFKTTGPNNLANNPGGGRKKEGKYPAQGGKKKAGNTYPRPNPASCSKNVPSAGPPKYSAETIS